MAETLSKRAEAKAEASPVYRDGCDPVKVSGTAKPLRKWKIMFQGKGGNVEIGHNYKLNSYPRNVWTEIDENFLGSLKAATIETIVKDLETNTTQAVRIQTIPYELGEEI